MLSFFNEPLQLGPLTLSHRLIQAPLAGYSCAPFRILFNRFKPPAYAVSEMISAQDIFSRHQSESRYLYRHPEEKVLAYQISGSDPEIMTNAAYKLQDFGADIIDINCGCPKKKIRQKESGSMHLENQDKLYQIIEKIRSKIHIPLTVKIRILNDDRDFEITEHLKILGVDAIIIHGRTWKEDYDTPCNWERIGQIKTNLGNFPVIANGDIKNHETLADIHQKTKCDGYMIARQATGNPWIYQSLLENVEIAIDPLFRTHIFIEHLNHLASLESEYQAILQGRSLMKYYFRDILSTECFNMLRQYNGIIELERIIIKSLRCNDRALTPAPLPKGRGE